MIDYISHDPQTVIRTARKDHRCSCTYYKHEHPEQQYGRRRCENIIRVGDRYPEHLGEVADFQSGSRYCPECAPDQLGEWIEKVTR